MKLVSFIYWICHLENGIINSQAEFSKFDSTVKKREEEGSCSPRLLCVDDVWEDTYIAHWFSRKPNCRKREVRSVGRAPWGSPQRNGARGCTCAPATEPATEGAGWLAGPRPREEEEERETSGSSSWAWKRIFVVGRAAPFIRSDVKLWQTTSSDRLNELRRCTRPRGEALLRPPWRSAPALLRLPRRFFLLKNLSKIRRIRGIWKIDSRQRIWN